MAKAKNSFEEMARDAAERLDKVRAAGEQLTFLPDEPGSAVDLVQDNPVGRPKGAKGKVSNQMREWLAARGYRMPEEVLAQMAGLASDGDAVMVAMQQAELVLAWAYDGAQKTTKGGDKVDLTPTPGQRLAAFAQLYTVQLRAADALLPYGAPKASPEAPGAPPVNIFMPGAPAQGSGPDVARDVTPDPSRLAPLDVRLKAQQNQPLRNSGDEGTDAE